MPYQSTVNGGEPTDGVGIKPSYRNQSTSTDIRELSRGFALF